MVMAQKREGKPEVLAIKKWKRDDDLFEFGVPYFHTKPNYNNLLLANPLLSGCFFCESQQFLSICKKDEFEICQERRMTLKHNSDPDGETLTVDCIDMY